MTAVVALPLDDGRCRCPTCGRRDRRHPLEGCQLPLPLPRPDELFGDDNIIPFAPVGAGAPAKGDVR